MQTAIFVIAIHTWMTMNGWLAGQLEDDLTHYLQEKLAPLAAKGIPYSRLNQRILKYWVVTAIGQNNWEKFPLEDQRAFIRMAQGMAFDMLGR
jgi:hypothetical protein